MKRTLLLTEQPSFEALGHHYRQITCARDGIALFYEFSLPQGAPQPVPIISDVCADLMFWADSHGEPCARIFGSRKKPEQILLAGGHDYFCVRFISGHTPLITGLLLPEMIGTSADSREADISPALVRNIVCAPDFETKAKLFLCAYQKQIAGQTQNSAGLVCREILRRSVSAEPVCSLTTLSEEIGYSKQYINRVFKRHTGYSVANFTNILRVQRILAGNLLHEASAVDIAANLGFCDQSHLIREFKKYVGQTPNQYMKQFAKRNGV